MQLQVAYLVPNGLTQVDIIGEVVYDNELELLVTKGKIKDTDIQSVVTLENPHYHEHLPAMITQMHLAQNITPLNLMKIHILRIDYPEQKYRFNSRTGEMEEILTPDERQAQKEMGGSTI